MSYWIILHFVLIRMIPRLFGYRAVSQFAYAFSIYCEAATHTRRYIFDTIELEEGFSEDDYRKWLQQKIAPDNDINQEFCDFGPKFLVLRYTKQTEFDMKNH
jgi:hypothetical protein